MSPILGSRGISPRSYGFAGAGKPNPPISVVATDVGTNRNFNNGAASVAFASGGDNGAPISSFTVTSSPSGFTASGASSPLVVTGLASATSYTFTVTATNSVGISDASTASSAVTATTKPQAPTIGTPTCATGQAFGATASISVPFTANATGGKTVSSFLVTSSSTATASGTSSPIAISQNTGSSYTYTVTATNANGTSTASGTSASVLSATVPQTPTIESVGINSDTNVTVNRSGATGGSAVTSVAVSTSPSLSLSFSGTSTALSVTGSYASGQAYTFTITTSNAYGTSETSNGVASTPNPQIKALFVSAGAYANQYTSLDSMKLTYSTETMARITGIMVRHRFALSSNSNYGTAGYITSGVASGSAIPIESLSTVTDTDKYSYTSDTYSLLTGCNISKVSRLSSSSLNNGTTTGYVFLDAFSNQTSNAVTVHADKMTYPTETYSNVRTWVHPFNSFIAAPFASVQGVTRAEAPSYNGVRGYLSYTSNPSLFKWEYSTDNYSTQTNSIAFSNPYNATLTNAGVASYSFAVANNFTARKMTFSNDTYSTTELSMSVSRLGPATGSNSATGFGYICNDSANTEKLTFSNETRSTVAIDGIVKNGTSLSNAN